MWQVIKSLGDFLKIKVHACVGGTAVREDITILMDGVHVVVGEFDCMYVSSGLLYIIGESFLSGTPGRVYDMISRRALKLDDVKLFVLDEADEMLSRGFKEQIYDGQYVCMYVSM